MCYPPTGYTMFSLKKLKFYGGRGPDMRVGEPKHPQKISSRANKKDQEFTKRICHVSAF